jgi:hypothetical protein
LQPAAALLAKVLGAAVAKRLLLESSSCILDALFD